eukprot:12410992-Karenia_brevis.AAC.1
MDQAQVEGMPALLQFASTVQELAIVPEWPVESTLTTPGVEEGDASGSVLGGQIARLCIIVFRCGKRAV